MGGPIKAQYNNLVLQEETKEERATGDFLVGRKQEGCEGSREVWSRSRVVARGQEHSQGLEETVTITWRDKWKEGVNGYVMTLTSAGGNDI